MGQPQSTYVPNPDRPIIIKPPARKSSFAFSAFSNSPQNNGQKPQVNISNRNSSSVPNSPTSPIISSPKIQLDSSAISIKGKNPIRHSKSSLSVSYTPQIRIENENMDPPSKSVSSSQAVSAIPLIKVVDSDSYESDSDNQKTSDFSTPMPAFMIEAANGINDSEDEDDDEADEKSINEDTTSKSKKDEVVAIDEFGFVHKVSEEEIPEGANGVQRMLVSNLSNIFKAFLFIFSNNHKFKLFLILLLIILKLS